MTRRQLWGLILTVIGVAFLFTGVGMVPGGLAIIFGIKHLATQGEEQNADNEDESPKKRRPRNKHPKERWERPRSLTRNAPP